MLTVWSGHTKPMLLLEIEDCESWTGVTVRGSTKAHAPIKKISRGTDKHLGPDVDFWKPFMAFHGRPLSARALKSQAEIFLSEATGV